ncbi:MAG: response regulator [Deltaproteobacteria bacterium]|nr:response regulator [Deltaproteobacteria bacterium]
MSAARATDAAPVVAPDGAPSVRDSECRSSEERYRQLFLSSTDAFVVVGEDGALVDLNPAASVLLGTHGQGSDPKIGIPPATLEVLGDVAASTFRDGAYNRYQSLPRGNGTTFEAVVSASLNRFEREVLVLIQDVTARRAAEAKLRTLSMVAEQAAISVVIADPEGRIEWANAAFTSQTGYSLQEVRGRRPGPLLQGPETDPATMQMLRDKIAAAEPVEAEILNYTKSGRPYWVRLSITPVFDESGKIQRFFSLQTDVTQDRRAKQELRRAKALAEENNRLKNRFLATVSHELRTPLNAVIGMTDLTLRTELTDEQRDLLRVVASNAETLLTTIGDILDLTSAEAGRLTLGEVEFSVVELCESVCEALSANLDGSRVELVCAFDRSLPPTVLGDPQRLRQILTNLVGNALKFTSDGHVTLHVGTTACARGDRRLLLCVEDTGIGIPKDKLDAIFESFVQSDPGDRQRFGGSGLGLSIAKELVTRMNGRLWCESEVGRGSRFFVGLPLRPGAGDQSPLRPDPELCGKRILVVDRCPAVARALEDILGAFGFDVYCEPCHESFVRRPVVDAWDVVVIDDRCADQLEPGLLRDAGAAVVLLGHMADYGRGRSPHTTLLTKPVRVEALRLACRQALGLRGIDGNESVVAEAPGSVAPGRVMVLGASSISWLVKARLVDHHYDVRHVHDGQQALEAAMVQRFDIVFTDLELPDMDGFEFIGRLRRSEERDSKRRTPLVAVASHPTPTTRRRSIAAGADDVLSATLEWPELRRMVEDLCCPPRRVLVVDDARDMRALLRRMLELEPGWVVTEASCGAQAIELAERESFDLMLVDCVLGDMEGVEVVTKVRRKQPEIVALAVSGVADAERLERLRRAGVVECVSKPVRREQLLGSLRRRFQPIPPSPWS